MIKVLVRLQGFVEGVPSQWKALGVAGGHTRS